jgi:hypothetical protein
VLEVDYVVAGDLASLGGVVVLAVGVRPFAGTAPRQPGIASRLALGICQHRSAYQGPGKLAGATYCAAAATGCEGMGGATLAVGAFLRGVRGGFRPRLRRRRDVHSSTVTKGRGAEVCWLMMHG